jgi:hypothetical protein
MRDRIPSESLAVLIVDRLIYAKCIDQSDLNKGITIAKSTIDSRKALGDYDGQNGLASVDLAMIIVNALIKSSLIAQHHCEKAVNCADEEIVARQAAGDY